MKDCMKRSILNNSARQNYQRTNLTVKPFEQDEFFIFGISIHKFILRGSDYQFFTRFDL